MKKIKSKKLLSSKNSHQYVVRKELITYDDGSTETRVGCYTFEGKYLGDFASAMAYFANQNQPARLISPKPVAPPTVGPKPVSPPPSTDVGPVAPPKKKA